MKYENVLTAGKKIAFYLRHFFYLFKTFSVSCSDIFTIPFVNPRNMVFTCL